MLKSFLKRLAPGRVRRFVQRRSLARALASFPVRTVRHRYGDGELTIELSDSLAAGWYDNDWPVLTEIGLLRSGKLRAGAIVFDLGAHQGVVALMLARETGPTGRVVAVEASPHNAKAAERNRDLNPTPWLEIVNAGVAAAEGTLKMSRSLNSQTAAASDYAGVVEVPALTVDSLSLRFGMPSVLFIDVEGMELDVLRGATATLATGPDAFVELHVGCGLESARGSVEAVLAHFSANRYERFVHTEANPSPIPLDTAPPKLFCNRFFLTALHRTQ